MDKLGIALGFYLILFILIVWAGQAYGMTLFSAVTVAALFSAIVLSIIVPPDVLDDIIDSGINDNLSGNDNITLKNTIAGIFVIIYLLTLFLVVWYVFDRAMRDIDSFPNC